MIILKKIQESESIKKRASSNGLSLSDNCY